MKIYPSLKEKAAEVLRLVFNFRPNYSDFGQELWFLGRKLKTSLSTSTARWYQCNPTEGFDIAKEYCEISFLLHGRNIEKGFI